MVGNHQMNAVWFRQRKSKLHSKRVKKNPRYGFAFIGRSKDILTLNINGATVELKQHRYFYPSLVSSVVFIFTRFVCSFYLHSFRVQFRTIPFTNARKRSSVIAQEKDKPYVILYTKGADDVMVPRIKEFGTYFMETITEHVDKFYTQNE